jgi:hypothetical protein
MWPVEAQMKTVPHKNVYCTQLLLKEGTPVRVGRFTPYIRWAILAMCSSIAIPLCFADCAKTTELATNLVLAHSPASIQDLAKTLQGKKGAEVETAIVRQFGPAVRELGSGVRIQQWDVESGVLTYSSGLVSFRAKSGGVVWLTATTNKALLTLTSDTFEMTTLPEPQMKYWLGNLRLKPDSSYEFVDSDQSPDHRRGQTQNFFIKHPSGRYEIHFAAGCTGETVLERLTEGTLLCSLTFLSANGGPQISYDIIVYPSERRLAFSTKRRPPVFLMDKGFAA